MAKTTSEKIRLGIFVVAGTLFLVVAAYLIGNNQSLFSKTFVLSSDFNNVNGLQVGNNVRFSGINVGTVKAISMKNDTVIRVQMSIEQKMQQHIKKNAVATIGSDGLVGNMLVNIIPGKGPSEPVKDGDEIASYSKIGADDLLSTLSVTNENAALLTADLLKVTQSLTKGKGTLGLLLNDTIMASNLKRTIENLKTASAQANTSINGLNSIIKKIDFEESVAGVVLNDTAMAHKMRNIMVNLETSTKEIGEMAQNLNSITSEIKQGKGAVNYLSTDTILVKDLEATMKNIEEGTRRFNENMEALKHNFLLRGYFKRLERKKGKN